jgi:hypothetical protein
LAVRGTWRSAPALLSTATWAPNLPARPSRRVTRTQLALLLDQLSASLAPFRVNRVRQPRGKDQQRAILDRYDNLVSIGLRT